MTHRRIRDGAGRSWDVWEVYPSAVERRISGEHKLPGEPPQGVERRREFRILVPHDLEAGGLAFRAGQERRRLAPIPSEWTQLTDGELLALLERADRLPDAPP